MSSSNKSLTAAVIVDNLDEKDSLDEKVDEYPLNRGHYVLFAYNWESVVSANQWCIMY